MKKQILLLCLALTSLCSYAQTITVKGVVTSASDKRTDDWCNSAS